MAKKGSLGLDLLREVGKRSVPRLRFSRLPRLSGRYSWMLRFVRDRIPARFLPERLKEQALQRVLRRQEAETELEQSLPPTAVPPDWELAPARVALPPPLDDRQELIGGRGRYRILQCLGPRGLGQIYQAEQLTADRPVVIKEYWLPEQSFSAAQIRQRQQTFTQLAGLNLADGRVQDARLIKPWDAIADTHQPRCYLVLPGQLGALPTLRAYLIREGAMDETQVRYFLNQTLQTLELLHLQKYRLPSSQVMAGLTHGNLGLDSLLIAGEGKQFFIYACDFALWESLFDPQGQLGHEPTAQQDLTDLGQVALQLLLGALELDRGVWPAELELSSAFASYLQRLCGIAPPFATATEARQALLRLPPIAVARAPDLWGTAAAETTPKRRRWPWGWIAGMLAALLLLAGLAGLWWWRSQPAAADQPLVSQLADVSGLPNQSGIFTALEGGSWDYVWKNRGLIRQGQALEDVLQRPERETAPEPGAVASPQPDWQLVYTPLQVPDLANNPHAVVEAVRTGQANFAVSGLAPPPRLELTAQTIAYDGLAVFVPFSYDLRDQSLPAALNGQLTLEQLRQLYLGEVESWNDLDRRLPRLKVQLYAPNDPEAIYLFEQRVLQSPSAIARFRERLATMENGILNTAPIQVQPTFPLLRQVLQDFENGKAGAIAFAPLSQVVGQCSVYPLALAPDAGGALPVQPLIQDDGTPITPQTDLCADKGSYFADVSAFPSQRYPLAFPLSVVYRRDNSQPPFGQKFAALLHTQEGQTLLQTTGLVPLQALDTSP